MSDFDPLAGTTIGPDGKRVEADVDGNPVESEKAIINEGDALADHSDSTTEEEVVDGTGEVTDAAEREAGGGAVDEQQGTGDPSAPPSAPASEASTDAGTGDPAPPASEASSGANPGGGDQS